MQEPWNCWQKRRQATDKVQGWQLSLKQRHFTHIWARLGKGVSLNGRSWSQDILKYTIYCVAGPAGATFFGWLRRGELCLGMFWCIMFALWVWGTEKPHCEDNSPANQPPPPSICRSTRPRNGDRPKCQQFYLGFNSFHSRQSGCLPKGIVICVCFNCHSICFIFYNHFVSKI